MAAFHFRTQQLSVGYDGKPLITDITFGVQRGEIVTLIGPNGSGKSTILKSITRQLRRLGGEVWLLDEELSRLSRRALSTRMSVVLTDRIRPELMTCRDIVAMGRYPYTGRLGILSPADEAEVAAAMEAVHISDLCDRSFDAVSDGQRQRVLLARALCQQPEIIVLDEPTSYLDVRHKLELLGILRTMARQKGITVIMSLHEIDLAQKVSDRILCVPDGGPVRFGAPEDLFTAEAIGALYAIGPDRYDPLFGTVELDPPAGEPRTFVICGAGTGIPVFRALQRADCPFIAGILHENDVDHHLARQLAREVVSEAPFEPVSEAALARACARMAACDRIIDACPPIGSMNARVGELRRRARAMPGYETWPPAAGT
ncbi:MAG: ABC transporter ATP-binding protein [Clostridia bacterium]|nr:ABC transporter ATP-binding protein [Clostridia bacterium]